MAGSEDYRRIRDRIVTLVSNLEQGQESLVVPATPLWTVHDVVAHLAGESADIVEGRLDGVATDPWTAAQVDARRDRSMAELLEEWDHHTPALSALIDALGDAMDVRLYLDLWTHEQDLRGALGRPGGADDPVPTEFAPMTAAGFERRAQRAGLAPLAVDVEGIGRDLDGTAPVTLGVDAFELIRGLVGRRSRDQIRRWEWAGTADTDPYAEALVVFTIADRDVVDAR